MTEQTEHPERGNPTEPPPADSATSVPMPSRRALLAGLGVGTAALFAPSVASASRGGIRDRNAGNRSGDNRGNRTSGQERQPVATEREPGPDQFSRLFDEHPPFAEADDELREMLADLGKPGGILDAKDPLEAGPIRLITEPELSPNNPDNPTHTAGLTFVGQFLDHDITHDAGSNLGRPSSVGRSTNLRSARFDLDSVYGGGPNASRDLYEGNDPFKLRVESGGLFEDLPRDASGTAIIGDARNDENLMISGLHAAFLMFHNAVLDRARAGGTDGQEAFEAARQAVRWHYQWMIVHEYLPLTVGQAMVDDVLRHGPQFYVDATPRIPVEFQAAAYRFGHSMVRPSYRANLAGDEGEPFFGFVFNPDTLTQADGGGPDPDDLSGGHRARRRLSAGRRSSTSRTARSNRTS